jgi:hypothetical protein
MTPNFIAQLAATGGLAPTPDNAQAFQMTWTGKQLEIGYAERHSATNVFSAHSHATLLGIGALAYNLDTALAANGVTGEWAWTAEAQPYGRLTLSDIPAAFTAPRGPAERHTNRNAFKRNPLPRELVAHLAAEREGDNRITVLEGASRTPLVRMVRLASEARFCNEALHHWLFGSLRHTPEQVAAGDGLDMNSLGLPPGGRAMLNFISDWPRMRALNRIGAYKLLARSEVGLLSAAPSLLCLSGPGDARGVIDAGRLLARVWTACNLEGIAVHPYYVVSDQLQRLHNRSLADGFEAQIGAIERDLTQLLELAPGQTLHMILRLGYPKKAAVRSRRLPLAAVFTDHSAARELEGA